MTVDERSRLQLAEALKRMLGDDEGITLTELLPPVGWADVATGHDLLQLEARMDLRFEGVDAQLESLEHRLEVKFERGFRTTLVTMMSLYVTGFAATIRTVVLTR
jgi:hypothetical protein